MMPFKKIILIFQCLFNCLLDFRILVFLTILFLLAKSIMKSTPLESLHFPLLITFVNIYLNCYSINGQYMSPTINPGDICFTSRIINSRFLENNCGTIAIVRFGKQNICKRVVAISGYKIIFENSTINTDFHGDYLAV